MTRRFDDLRVGDETRTSLLLITDAELDDFLRITGENHPLHHRDRVVPAGLLHSRAAGALISADQAWEVAGLRSMRWRCCAPLRTQEEFCVVGRIQALQPLTDDVGLVTATRRLITPDDTLLAQGHIEMAVLR